MYGSWICRHQHITAVQTVAREKAVDPSLVPVLFVRGAGIPRCILKGRHDPGSIQIGWVSYPSSVRQQVVP